MPFGDIRKLQKMEKAERCVGITVVNRELVFFYLIARGDGREIQKMKKALLKEVSD